MAGKDPKQMDALITAALDRLMEIGPNWRKQEQDQWTDMFLGIVAMVYPAKPERAPRKKKVKLDATQGA